LNDSLRLRRAAPNQPYLTAATPIFKEFIVTRRTAVIGSRAGLHARPASAVAALAAEYPFDIAIALEGGDEHDGADAGSILHLMSLGAQQGDTVVLLAESDDAEEALEALVSVLETDHDAVRS
jgi:phosphocarrier protein